MRQHNSTKDIINKGARAVRSRITMVGLAVLMVLQSQALQAADIEKANNTTALNLAGSYTAGGPPGSGDRILVNNVMTANQTASLGGNLSISGIVFDATATRILTINGSNTLTLGSAGITLTTGTTGNLILNGPAIILGASQTWDLAGRGLTINGGTTINENSNSLTITGTGGQVFFHNGTSTLNAQLNGGFALTLDSSPSVADLTLTNSASTFTGGAAISTGSTLTASTMKVGTGTNSAVGTGAIQLKGGTFKYSGNTATVSQSVTHDSRFVSTFEVTTSGQTLTLTTIGDTNTTNPSLTQNGLNLGGAGNLTLTGVLADSTQALKTATNITKFGAGTLTLSGNNTYTGLTDVQAGILILNRSGGTIANASAVQVSGGTLDVAQSDTVGAVTLSSGTISGAGTLTGSSYSLTNTGTVSAALGGTGVALTKTGAGTATLSGTNTYTGATTVSAGTLLINGSTAAGSAVTVAGGASLGGSGTVAGLVTTSGVTSVISAGNSPGTLNLTGGLNAAAGADFVFELGTTSDLINLGSGVFTGSSAANGLQFEFINAGGLLAGTAYTLFSFGSSSGLDYSDFLATVLPSGLMLDSSFGTNGYLINGSNLQVQFAAVPEPSTYTMIGAGLLVLGTLRRANRKRP